MQRVIGIHCCKHRLPRFSNGLGSRFTSWRRRQHSNSRDTTSTQTAKTDGACNRKPVLPPWIVDNPRTKAAIPILGNLAYITLASGFLCTDVLSLRGLLVCGYTGLVSYHALRPKPLLIPLRWSLFFVLVNGAMAIKFVMDEMPVVLSEEEEATYIQYFAPLTRKQFRRLIDLATIAEYHQGELLTRVNMPCDKLYLILEGTATMKGENGKHISVLQRGSFPNCMSFQRCGWDAKRRWSNDRDKNKPLNTSYATIKCEERVKCLVWDGTELLRLLDHESSENGGSMRLRLDHVGKYLFFVSGASID